MSSHLFSSSMLRNHMGLVFEKHAEKLAQLLLKQAKLGEPVDLQNLMQCFTFDTMCEVAFGVSPGAVAAAAKGEKPPSPALGGGRRDEEGMGGVGTPVVIPPRLAWDLMTTPALPMQFD